MAKSITLTRGKVALVDDADYEWLNKYKWSYNGNGYARRVTARPEQITILMHREIMNPPDGYQVDHIDMNPLNNQRSNLRICTKSQNGANVMSHNKNNSRYKGVFPNKNGWFARIVVNRKPIYLGTFDNAIDAARAYNTAASEYFGNFARLNELP